MNQGELEGICKCDKERYEKRERRGYRDLREFVAWVFLRSGEEESAELGE